MFLHNGITPHFFQFIETPGIGKHYMNDNIYIIDDYPLQHLSAFMHIGCFTTFPLYFRFHEIRYSPDLCSACSLTNNKKIRYCFLYFPEIKRYDFFAFFFLNCLDNDFYDFRVPR